MSDNRSELRAAALHGVRWISLARILAEATALASSVVLARLIPPAEFGRAAVALIVVAFAAIVGPGGLTASIVQRRQLSRQHIEAASFISVVVGAGLTLSTIAFVPAARSLFGEATAELILFASPVWLIAGFGAVSQAMLQRDLRFRRIAFVDSLSLLGGASSAVGLAAVGLEGKALVCGGLITVALANILAVQASRPVVPRPSREGLGEVGGFAALVALSSLAYAGFRNVDYAILGVRMSAANVGYYWRAYQVGVEYQSKLSQIMLRISFPIYSRSETLEDLRALRTRIVRVHASVIVPLLAAFVALAPVAIPWLFGDAWVPAVLPAQIMAVAGVGHALTTGVGPIMVAIGRPGLLLGWNIIEFVAYGTMIYLLAPSGLVAVSIGVAAFSLVGFVLTQVVLLRPLIGLPVRSSLSEAVAGFAVGGFVLAVLWPLRVGLEGAVPRLVVLVLCGSVGVAVAAAALRALFRDTWDDLASIGRRVAAGRRDVVVER